MKWFLVIIAAAIFGAAQMGYIDATKLGLGKDPAVQKFEDFYLLYARYEWDKANTFLTYGSPAMHTIANKRRLAAIAGSMGMWTDVKNISLDITGKTANEEGDRIEYEGVLIAVVNPNGQGGAMGRPVTHDVSFTSVKEGEVWKIHSFTDEVRTSR